MARKSSRNTQAPLREFIKENEGTLYSFIELMVPKKEVRESVLLETFREFGSFFRRQHTKCAPSELKTKLFTIAWSLIVQSQDEDGMRWLDGRDTRKMGEWDVDLLSKWSTTRTVDDTLRHSLFNRIQLVSNEFKAPLVLKDILGLEDEEIMRVLGSRWGVYRHRLHRGRMDLLHELKGQEKSA